MRKDHHGPGARALRWPSVLAAAALAAGASGCAHAARPDVLRPAAEARCEDAAAALAHPPPHPAGDEVRRAFTAPASVLLTGTGYAVDGAAVVGGGVLLGTTICLPLLALEASVHGNGEASAECIVRAGTWVIVSAPLPGLGELTADATRSWRCLDRTAEAREALATARCFTERNWPGDLDVARTVLTRLRTDGPRFRCYPAQERLALDRAFVALQPQAAAGPPEPVPVAEAEPEAEPAADEGGPPPAGADAGEADPPEDADGLAP